VHECECARFRLEAGEDIRHRNEHREARPPTGLAVSQAELRSGAKYCDRPVVLTHQLEKGEDRLRAYECETVLEAF
jgi:hypothetical protein